MIRFVSPTARAQAVAHALDALGPAEAVAPDVCLVLGGDGTMLRAIHAHGEARAFFGVNCGRLGFLMNDLAGEPAVIARHVWETLATEAWRPYRFPMLPVVARAPTGDLIRERAVNDVVLERSSGQTVHLRVAVDDEVIVDRLVCDGIIVATPLGSTGYSFSAGGPASHPQLHAIHLTAICPHRPRLAPLVLPETSRLQVTVLDAVTRPAHLVVDGGQVEGAVDTIEVSGGGPAVTLGFLDAHDFTVTMIRKLLQP